VVWANTLYQREAGLSTQMKHTQMKMKLGTWKKIIVPDYGKMPSNKFAGGERTSISHLA
jgi:hypothetical protein